MLLSDVEIREACCQGPLKTFMGLPSFDNPAVPLIEPFSEAVSGNGIVSYGLTTAGYDIRLSPQIYVFKNTHGEVIDPKRFKDPDYFAKVFDVVETADAFTLPAHSYVLGVSVEYFRMPRGLKGRCVGKSTYARCGVVINTTPLEPGWEGRLTIEIANETPLPVKIYAGEGIAQVEFELLSSRPGTTYADKGGKYQGQTGVTPARVL